MTKITEASTLSGLGIPDNVVKKIHNQMNTVLDHDHEFEELKTKGQMQSKLKAEKLIIGFSPVGVIGSIRMSSGRYKSYHGTLDAKGLDSQNSMKDMLNNFPGRGWKWFASVKDWDSKKSHEYRGEQGDTDSDWDKQKAFMSKLEKVHGPKLRQEAAQYAEDIKDVLVAFATSDEVKSNDHSWRDTDPNDQHMGYLRKGMHKLRKVANSDEPHHEFSPGLYDSSGFRRNQYGVDGVVDANVGEPKTEYDFQKVDDKSGKWMRNAKLGTAKVAQLFLRELRAYRDKVIDAAKENRASKTNKRSLGKVKKAWESYKQTGKVNIIPEGRYDDVEQIPTGGADYSGYSLNMLKAMLEPGALHADERGFKRLIRAELKRRTKGKAK